MYELLIVDDETLAQIGIKSLLDYEKLGIKVVGSASNGEQALEFINQFHPQIVITDIKMPVMDGLELVEHCNSKMENPPKFIILTGFDEFEYVRRAMRSNVVDYIIKVELNEVVLQETLKKAVGMIKDSGIERVSGGYAYDILLNRMLTQLLSHTFSTQEEFEGKLEEFSLDMDGDLFVAVAVDVNTDELNLPDHKARHNMLLAVMNTMKTIIPKYTKGCIMAYSSSLIGVILSFSAGQDWEDICQNLLAHVGGLETKYFNITLKFGVGAPKPSLMNVSTSFAQARRVLREMGSEDIMFYRASDKENIAELDQSEIFQDITSSLESSDPHLFSNSINRVAADILNPETSLESAIDNISRIIHTIIVSLDSGKKILEEVFSFDEKSYHIVYSCSHNRELEQHLRRIQKEVVQKLEEYQQCPKNRLVVAAQKYVQKHISEKLTLGTVAKAIDVTPNYLSSIFKKYCHYGFNDYVTFEKIRRAQQLLLKSNLKVYQIADMLGFDSPYYFSTVYKKFTGFSPKETAAIHRISQENGAQSVDVLSKASQK